MRFSIRYKLFITLVASFFIVFFLFVIFQHIVSENFYEFAKINQINKDVDSFIDRIESRLNDEDYIYDQLFQFNEDNYSASIVLNTEEVNEGLYAYIHPYLTVTANEEIFTVYVDNSLISKIKEYEEGFGCAIYGRVLSEDSNVVYAYHMEVADIEEEYFDVNLLKDEEFFPFEIDIVGLVDDIFIEDPYMIFLQNIILENTLNFWEDINDIDFESFNEILVDKTTGKEYIFSVNPFYSDDVKYLVISAFPLEPIKDAIVIMEKYYLFFFVGAMVFVMIISFMLSKIITRPIIKINRVTNKIAQNDFNNYLDIKSRDELEDLATSINTLSANLSNSLNNLERANKKLKEDFEHEKYMENTRKTYVSAVSHEFKTPLSVIQGVVEGLLYNIYDRNENEKYHTIMKQVVILNGLVEEMLELSKLENDLEVKKQKCNLSHLVIGLVDKFDELIHEKEQRISLNLEEISITADRRKISLAISNLISNAIKYSPNEEKVEIILKPLVKGCYFSIENTGVAIPEDEIDNIWSIFYRADKSRSKDVEGFGIGLSVVQKVFEIHGYEYGVKNTRNGVLIYFISKE